LISKSLAKKYSQPSKPVQAIKEYQQNLTPGQWPRYDTQKPGQVMLALLRRNLMPA
jgi:hypothetical protein